MRRVIISVVLLLATAITRAQDFSVDVLAIDNSLTRVYETSSNNAEKKHLLAKEWAAKKFGDYKSALQFEDDQTHKIIIKGYSNVNGGILSYTITVDSKDDKYRVKIEDLIVKDYAESPDDKKRDISFREYVDTEASIFACESLMVDYLIKADSLARRIEELKVIRENARNNTNVDYSDKPKGVMKPDYRYELRKRCENEIFQCHASYMVYSTAIKECRQKYCVYTDAPMDAQKVLEGILKSIYNSLSVSDDF